MKEEDLEFDRVLGSMCEVVPGYDPRAFSVKPVDCLLVRRDPAERGFELLLGQAEEPVGQPMPHPEHDDPGRMCPHKGFVSLCITPSACGEIDVGRDQAPEIALSGRSGILGGEDLVESGPELIRGCRVGAPHVRGSPHGLAREFRDDPVPGLPESLRIQQERFVQPMDQDLDLLTADQHAPRLPDEVGLELDNRFSPLHHRHQPVYRDRDRLAFLHQTQVVSDQDELLSLMLNRKIFEVTPHSRQTVVH